MLVEQQNNDGDDGQRFELQEDPSFWKDNSVQVVIRLRPLSSSEISLQGYNTCVRQDSCHSITWIGHPESRFTFDLVVDEHISQEELFKVAGVPMVENCVAGYNSCMFAYGQTGSGKTHTMLGDIEGGTRRHSVNCGMTPRVFEYLFTRIQKEKESRRDEKLRFTCKCSFLEIYNEQILDLLDPSTLNLQIREDAKKGVYVENLKEFEVSSARDVMQHLIQGAANRKVAATNMNRASSRSHSVFNCSIESKWESQGVTHLRFARLNLVDLAGSERQKSSGAEGERLKEATNINKSLSTLGLVIMNLVHVSSKKAMHVPYRDSKLTFLLQDSLGGNSKTIIIANISPSNCCALETLSTLKFAQRAKFIRNNAIVNEDASGDILSMRLQIQHLKKEVNRLQGLVHGADNQDGDNLSTHFPGSPGSFKWDGGQGLFSPLISDKRFSKKREDEASLVAAFRRDQDKESTLKALVAEKEAAEQLANQRTEEVKGLKMRLRFREEGIKRLEGVASGKLSAETHLLQERGELMKEIEILRNQVDRNPEVTRFAMENLQLKEELRRLQSFVEEGEREMMNEQITALQDKLLEALDWKLMHEKDPVIQDPSLSWDSSINEENEFLRMEAIKNQREVEALRINLNFCLEAKEKLERRVIDLVSELEEETKSKNAVNETSKFQQTCQPIASSSDEQPDNQMQLKTMVDAIATASQREAEAHETAIVLAKENEDLRGKLKVLIDDNNKLIELYESIAAEGNTNKDDNALQEENTEDLTGCLSDVVVDKYGHELRNQEIKDAEHLECQLIEMHEENEKLMNLYEQAMRERDEFKKMLCSTEQSCVDIKEIGCVEKLVEVDEEKVNGSGNVGENLKVHVKFLEVSEEKLHLAKEKLELVQDKLLTVAGDISILGLIEKASIEFENISEKTEAVVQDIQLKQQEIISLELTYSEIQERKLVMDNKFLALKSALPKFSSNVESWGEREAQARARVEAHSGFVLQKKEELAQLQSSKNEIDGTFVKDEQSEAQMRDNFRTLSSKFQDYEAQRRETERVLFGIDNLNRTEVSTQRTLQFGKASEMLKAEVERTKLAAEMKLLKEKIAAIEKKKVSARKMSESLDTKIQIVDEELRTGFQSLEESQIELQKVTGEKILLSEMEETGRSEVEKLFIDYQESVFDLDLKEAELRMCREDLQLDMKSLEEFRAAQTLAIQKMNHLMDQSRQHSLTISDSGDHLQYVSQKLECELGYVQNFVHEAKSLLLFNSNNR